MTPKRFAALVAAYGGRIERWPQDERDAADAHRLTHPDAEPRLDGEAALDTALGAWSAEAEAACAAAPLSPVALARRVVERRRRLHRLRLFLSGFGATAAVAAGAAAGVVAVALSGAPGAPASSIDGLTVLGVPIDSGRAIPGPAGSPPAGSPPAGSPPAGSP